jgi:23S rRNA (guanosine2251-2'-O)-methyltransferase
VATVPRATLDRYSEHQRHQGVVLQVSSWDVWSEQQLWAYVRKPHESLSLVALDGITDPHNLGAMIRSAESAGCGALLLPKNNSCPLNGVVAKAACGALATLPVCYVTNLCRTLRQLKKEQSWVYGLAGEASQSLYALSFDSRHVWVVGAEGKGLRPQVRQQCDALVSIPLRGATSSLNASVALGVALFEGVRQQEMKKVVDKQ